MLAILTTHPIQYQVPLWQALAREGTVPFEVWYLSRHGVEPSPDAEFKKPFVWDIDLLKGYPHQFLQTNPNPKVHKFWGVRLREDLRSRFRKNGVKALWIQGWQVFAYWQAVWQAHDAGVEVWVRGETNDLAPIPFWKRLPKKMLLRTLFKKISRFLYIGEANRRLYETYGIPREQLYPAPYCVDNERFARQAGELLPQRAAIRREWKISDNAFCILFAGKFIPKKRPLDLVRAVSNGRLSHSSCPIHLLFVGSGELGAVLRQVCEVIFDGEAIDFPLTFNPLPPRGRGKPACRRGRGEGAKPRASFVGFLNQTEISKAYVAADCLVLPSDSRETWGLVVNEAMASGLPCIASDACGASEDLVQAVHPRLRFRVGNPEKLADAILFLTKTPFKRGSLQEQAARFAIEHSAETVSRLYRLSLGSK